MIKIVVGDCREAMRAMPAKSVQTCCTSPPYFGLRDYQIEPSAWSGNPDCQHEWSILKRVGGTGGQGDNSQRIGRSSVSAQEKIREAGAFCRLCGAWLGSFGLEPNHHLYVEHAVEIFREVWRVLRDDGTLWLNLGDSYANDGKWGGETGGKQAYLDDANRKRIGREKRFTGLKPKDLIGVPWRVALALQDDGWFLRQDIVWAKPSPMPESVRDRCTKSHEYIFLLTKRPNYHFDQEAILEPLSPNTHLRVFRATLAEQLGSDKVPGKTNGMMKPVVRGGKGVKNNDHFQDHCSAMPGRRSGNKERKPASERGTPEGTGKNQAGSIPWEGFERNKRSVWSVTPQPFAGEFCKACRTYFDSEGLAALKTEQLEEGGRKIRRRHYSCAKDGSARGQDLLVLGPGEKMLLLTACARAVFGWRRERFRRDGQEGIECAIFRNEGAGLSSDLVRRAQALADARWPGARHFTHVDPEAVRGTCPGYCFIRAGWRTCGWTKVHRRRILESLPEWRT